MSYIEKIQKKGWLPAVCSGIDTDRSRGGVEGVIEGRRRGEGVGEALIEDRIEFRV
jgi:hypothetical protein